MDGKVEGVLEIARQLDADADGEWLRQVVERGDIKELQLYLSGHASMLREHAAAWRAAQGVEVGEFERLLQISYSPDCSAPHKDSTVQCCRICGDDTPSHSAHCTAPDIVEKYRAQAAALVAAEQVVVDQNKYISEVEAALAEAAKESYELRESGCEPQNQLNAATAESVRLAGEVQAAPTTVLSDNAEFHLHEREFFCPNCKDFRDVVDNQNDIVCYECAWIIATYKDRGVIAAPHADGGTGENDMVICGPHEYADYGPCPTCDIEKRTGSMITGRPLAPAAGEKGTE
jgi:hypothetical protein